MKKGIKKAASNIARLVPNLMSGVELEFFSRTNITSSQLITIMTIYSLGKCTMGQMARNLYVTMPTVTGLVNRLVRQGLVERSRSKEDRRKIYIILTPKGVARIKDFQAVVHRRWERLLAALTSKEIRTFQEILVKLHDCIKAHRVRDEQK